MSFNLSDEKRGQIIGLLLLVVVFGSITFSIAYDNFESFSRALETAAPPGDTADYLHAFFEPQDLLRRDGTLAYRDYRLAAPLLAHLVPDPPESIFRTAKRVDPLGLAVFKFATITALFNFATCVLVYAICRWFNLSRLLSLLGGALYSTLTFVVIVNGIPHVDSVFYFVFGLGAYAVLRKNLALILLSVLVGTFVKEAIFLLGVLALLLPDQIRFRIKVVAAMVPGALVYVAVRYVLLPSNHDYFTSGEFLPIVGVVLQNLGTLNGLEWVIMGFNFLWLPMAWALLRDGTDTVLMRWSLFLPILVVVTVLGGSDHFGRSLPLAFPVAIPLAMLGIRAMIDRIEADETVATPTAVSSENQMTGSLARADRGLSPEVP